MEVKDLIDIFLDCVEDSKYGDDKVNYKTLKTLIDKKLPKQLTLSVVSNRRELLLGFQKSEYFDLYEQGVIEYKYAVEKHLS